MISAIALAVAATCAFPTLDFSAAESLGAKEQAAFTANFRAAFDKACAEGLFATEPLIDERAIDKGTLFVLHAPEANVTSIYFSHSAAPPAMLVESPFGEPPQVPSAEELHEAIYCAMVGATEQEMEESGRCLPD